MPLLPLLDTGDRFGEENISLFEQRRGNLEAALQVYSPFGRPLSDIMEEKSPAASKSHDSTDDRASSSRVSSILFKAGEDKDHRKPFEFVVRYTKLNPWLLVIVMLFLIATIVLAIELHIQADRTSQRTDSLPLDPTTSSAISSEGSSVVVITTSTTLQSGFKTVVVPITDTEQGPQPSADSSTPVVQDTVVSITTANPSTTVQITMATTVEESSDSSWSTPAATALQSVEPHALPAFPFFDGKLLNLTLPLSKRRLRQSGIDATDTKRVARPTSWRSKNPNT